MRLLLDTHALLWWLAGDKSLSAPARRVIGDTGNTSYVSAASAWEIATKYRLGKLPGAAAIVDDLGAALAAQAFEPLPITVVHAQRAGLLPGAHRDPFDRMVISQALQNDMTVLTADELVKAYPIKLFAHH